MVRGKNVRGFVKGFFRKPKKIESARLTREEKLLTEAEVRKLLKKERRLARREARRPKRGVGTELRRIKGIVGRREPTRRTIPQPKQMPRRINPFEHRSNREVFGDEGLTIFDSTKPTVSDTGSLFGIK